MAVFDVSHKHDSGQGRSRLFTRDERVGCLGLGSAAEWHVGCNYAPEVLEVLPIRQQSGVEIHV
jgi:hypothetical protein